MMIHSTLGKIHSTIQLYLLLMSLVASVQALNLQMPFLPSHKPVNTLKLKTIYHHASAHGPIPNLFRKIDIDNTRSDISINQAQDATYTLQGTFSVMDKPITADIQDLVSQRKYGTFARWNNRIRPMHLESTIGLVPDVTHRPSVLALAMMTNNAYLDINLNNTEWYDLGAPWQLLIVVSIKGTSAGLWSGGPTGEKDKLNDNMLFSCCCARISRAWTPVCDCYQGNEYKCENSCLQKSIQKSELYYDNALNIIEDIKEKYENSTIWITGHSLGGAVASLVGLTYGIPTVTFEIPGDRLASSRLHLPSGPGAKDMPLWHFGHTADPIFVGVCTGPSSSCWYGSFAMETRCHTGKVCVWDTVKDNGWRVDIRSHRVRDVIENILKKPEEFPLPNCQPEENCTDCGLWEYFDDRDAPLSSDSATSTTSTRTSTSQHAPDPPTDPWTSTDE
ncbi:Alpha/Beta hydrolase protein [Mucor lusitanicus]